MFKISDDYIKSIVKQSYDLKAKEAGLIKEQEERQQVQINTGCDEIPVYPRLNLDKLIGKKQPTDVDARQFRQILERVNASVEGNDIKSRIRSLNKVLESIIKGDTSGMKIDQLISRFIFLDSFLSLLDRSTYEPQMAGLLLEPLLAAVLKGEQMGGTEVISDFEIPNLQNDMTGISLKLKSDNKVEGSFALFIKGLMTHGVIGFYHIQKFSSEEGPVSGIKVSYYEVRKPWWLDGQIESMMIEYSTSDLKGANSPAETIEAKKAEIASQFNNEAERAGLLDRFLKPGSPEREYLLSNLSENKRFQDLGVRADKARINFNINDIAQRTSLGSIAVPTREQMRETAKNSINSLNDQVAGLYRSIGMLSCVMKNYTAGESVTREEFAGAASEHAADILKTAKDIQKGE